MPAAGLNSVSNCPASRSQHEAALLLEVYGLVAAFAAADAACKAADVTIEAMDKNKPANAERLPIPLIVLVKLRGALSDIQAALEAGAAAAGENLISTRVIARPDEETEKMLKINVIQ